MADDREQQRREGRGATPRPVTAAARRERRSTTAGDMAEPRPRAGRAKNRVNDRTVSNQTSRTERKGSPTPTRERTEKRSLGPGRVIRFLREVVAELRKVIWPTRKQMITYFSVVLVFLVMMVALVFGLDVLFQRGAFWIFG